MPDEKENDLLVRNLFGSLGLAFRNPLAAAIAKARPWAYQKEIAARRREAALLRELVSVIGKHGFDLESVTDLLKSVTTRSDGGNP
jgi:chorismate mutase